MGSWHKSHLVVNDKYSNGLMLDTLGPLNIVAAVGRPGDLGGLPGLCWLDWVAS
jgi:hypothetical protein